MISILKKVSLLFEGFTRLKEGSSPMPASSISPPVACIARIVPV
jgi:hypothetical protein